MAFLFPATALAQLPKDLERCLPYPTYAEEIRDMLGAGPLGKRSRNVAWVESVNLRGGSTLPPKVREEIIALLFHREFDADTDWLREVQDTEIRGLLQENGYFAASLGDAQIKTHANLPVRSRVAVTLNIEEGLQYRLASIDFASDDPERKLIFSAGNLRAGFPIFDGELLVVSKLRQGLDALRPLYGSLGYIDIVAEPNFEMDNDRREVTVLIYLNQGLQFRIAEVEFRGLTDDQMRSLKGAPRAGEIFDTEKLKRFFTENQPLLRCPTPENLEVWRDIQNGTVNLTFQIQTCHQQLERFLNCLSLRMTMPSR